LLFCQSKNAVELYNIGCMFLGESTFDLITPSKSDIPADVEVIRHRVILMILLKTLHPAVHNST